MSNISKQKYTVIPSALFDQCFTIWSLQYKITKLKVRKTSKFGGGGGGEMMKEENFENHIGL